VREDGEAWPADTLSGNPPKNSFPPLFLHPRPAWFYAGIEVIYGFKHALMIGAGFRSHTHRGYHYYSYGQARSCGGEKGGEAQVPVLFLHGVGIGLLPYITFVWRLAASGQPVLVFEIKHLGMRWTRDIPTEDEVAEAVVEVAEREGVPRLAVVRREGEG
jgi:hypothetical protein